MSRTDAQLARDEAIDTVVDNAGSFAEEVKAAVKTMPPGAIGTGEDIRLYCTRRGIVPHHHNAWGGVIMGLVKAGVLKHTGKYQAMKTERSHARRTPIYVVC